MDKLHQFEQTAAGWYKDVPHLPVNVRKWIAENIWWIVLVVVIISIFGALSLFSLLTGVSMMTAGYGMYGYGYNHAATGMALGAAWIGLAALVLQVVIQAMAIAPLKDGRKKGWDLLFLSDLVYFAFAVVGSVISFQFFGIVGPFIGTAIGLYFLFEIRSHFLQSKTAKVAPVKKSDTEKAKKTEE